jgi:hypothetical protein
VIVSVWPSFKLTELESAVIVGVEHEVQPPPPPPPPIGSAEARPGAIIIMAARAARIASLIWGVPPAGR